MLVLSELRCITQNDVLKEFMVWNTYIYPTRKFWCRVTTDAMGYTLVNMPLFNSVIVSGYHIQEAGADADLELVFTIADGLEYVRTAIEEANLKVDGLALRLLFFWGIRVNFYT